MFLKYSEKISNCWYLLLERVNLNLILVEHIRAQKQEMRLSKRLQTQEKERKSVYLFDAYVRNNRIV